MLIEGLVAMAAIGLGAHVISRRGRRGVDVPDVQPRRALVLYTAAGANIPEFERNAFAAAQHFGTNAVPISDGQTLLNAIRTAPRDLGLVLMIGHGSGGAFFRPGHAGLRIDRDALPTWLGDDTFARELTTRLATNFVLSLAGCRAGAESREPDWTTDAYWTGTTPGPGGARSLAGEIRDALVAAGAPAGEMRAHTTTGGVLANPGARTFVVAPQYAGRPGAALIDLVLGPSTSRDRAKVTAWNARVRGVPATRWILGGRAPTRQEAAA